MTDYGISYNVLECTPYLGDKYLGGLLMIVADNESNLRRWLRVHGVHGRYLDIEGLAMPQINTFPAAGYIF